MNTISQPASNNPAHNLCPDDKQGKAFRRALTKLKRAVDDASRYFQAEIHQIREQLLRDIGANELTDLLPEKYRAKAEEIIRIVRLHNEDRAIVKGLKRAGLVSKTTYWKDVTFFHRLRDSLATSQQDEP